MEESKEVNGGKREECLAVSCFFCLWFVCACEGQCARTSHSLPHARGRQTRKQTTTKKHQTHNWVHHLSLLSVEALPRPSPPLKRHTVGLRVCEFDASAKRQPRAFAAGGLRGPSKSKTNSLFNHKSLRRARNFARQQDGLHNVRSSLALGEFETLDVAAGGQFVSSAARSDPNVRPCLRAHSLLCSTSWHATPRAR